MFDKIGEYGWKTTLLMVAVGITVGIFFLQAILSSVVASTTNSTIEVGRLLAKLESSNDKVDDQLSRIQELGLKADQLEASLTDRAEQSELLESRINSLLDRVAGGNDGAKEAQLAALLKVLDALKENQSASLLVDYSREIETLKNAKIEVMNFVPTGFESTKELGSFRHCKLTEYYWEGHCSLKLDRSSISFADGAKPPIWSIKLKEQLRGGQRSSMIYPDFCQVVCFP